MVPEWAYGAAITALVTVLGILWRDHLAQDKRERQRADRIDTANARIVDTLRDALRKAEPK